MKYSHIQPTNAENIILRNLKFEGSTLNKENITRIIENVSNTGNYGLNALLKAVALCMLDERHRLEIKLVDGFKSTLPGKIISGKTHFSANRITISGKLPPEEFAAVLLHECTHYVTYKIAAQREQRRNIRDFCEFRKAFRETLSNIKSEKFNEPAHLYMKGLLYDRVKMFHPEKIHGYRMSEFFAQIPVMLMLSEFLVDGRQKAEQVAGPILAFYSRKAVPELENFIRNHPQRKKVAGLQNSDKTIEL